MLLLSITFFKKCKTKKAISPYPEGLAGPLLGKGVGSEL